MQSYNFLFYGALLLAPCGAGGRVYSKKCVANSTVKLRNKKVVYNS
jgi:hypothetical protein